MLKSLYHREPLMRYVDSVPDRIKQLFTEYSSRNENIERAERGVGSQL